MHASKTLRAYWLAHPRLILFTLACTILTVGLNLWTPFLVREAIDRMVDGSATPARIVQLSAIFLIASLVAAFGSRGMRGIPSALTHHVMRDIRADAMGNLTRLDPSFYRGEHTGDIMNRMNTDVKAVGDMVGQGLMNVSRAVFAFGIAMAIMFGENTRLAWLMLVLLPAMTGISFVLILLLRKRYEASQEQFDRISSFSQENFTGVRVIKGFGIEDRQAGLFRDLNREYIRRNLAFSRIEAPIWPLITFMFSAASVLLLWVGGRQVMAGELTLGTLVQFLQYLTFLQWPVLALGWTLGLFIRGVASWKRLDGILRAAPHIDDTRAESASGSAGLDGDITFENVTLDLGGTRVLDHVSLVLPAGRTVAVTGPTGCGKSTLASLLVRLADPDTGRVTAGGRDLRAFSLETLRNGVRAAPQEPFLFSDTIGRNLEMGAPGAPNEALRAAATVARVEEEIERFPKGYETLVGERGVTLSGGQRQRVSIARAIAGDPRVLILDDTLSAVDTHTEKAILEGLLPIIRGRTTLLISHRISTLRYADLIVVMDRGRIVQTGTHDELVARPGYYQELDTAQRLQARLEAFS